jgi:hypothetical protein
MGHGSANLTTVVSDGEGAGARGAQAASYLRMLFVRPGELRTAWEKHADSAHPGELDPAAIAAVLNSESTGERVPVPVARAAIDGTELTSATLERFIEAFDLGPRHATRLRGLLRGSDSVRVITGSALSELRALQPSRHETLAVHELHTLGADGLPAEHQTIQVIKSTVDELSTYQYRFDTDQLVVEVVRGGRVGDVYRFNESLYGVDIVLDRPLGRGETTLMHYRMTFGYLTPPPTEFRRGVVGTMRDVTLWVQFHPDRVPARVWQARWDRLDDATIIEEQLVELDGELSAQARYDHVEDSLLGFHWSWD